MRLERRDPLAAHVELRGDLFEIVVISIVGLTLIAAGPLLGVVFRRAVLRWSAQVPEPAQQATDGER